MAGKKAIPEIDPMAFINGALSFAWAADELQRLLTVGNDQHADPVYLLMAHSIELALKGYLRLRGLATATLAQRQYGHSLQALLNECEQQGFPMHGDRMELRDVVRMLDDSNRRQGLRYFTLETQTFPEVRWGIAAVHDIVAAALQAALNADPDAEKPGPAVKANFTVGKPHPKP